jgi:hypothetical protein
MLAPPAPVSDERLGERKAQRAARERHQRQYDGDSQRDAGDLAKGPPAEGSTGGERQNQRGQQRGGEAADDRAGQEALLKDRTRQGERERKAADDADGRRQPGQPLILGSVMPNLPRS